MNKKEDWIKALDEGTFKLCTSVWRKFERKLLADGIGQRFSANHLRSYGFDVLLGEPREKRVGMFFAALVQHKIIEPIGQTPTDTVAGHGKKIQFYKIV
jgi:hypothetical protein